MFKRVCCICNVVDGVATCPACRRRVCNAHLVVSVQQGTTFATAASDFIQHPNGMTPIRFRSLDYRAGYCHRAPACVRCCEAAGDAADVSLPQYREAKRRQAEFDRLEAISALIDTAPSHQLLEVRFGWLPFWQRRVTEVARRDLWELPKMNSRTRWVTDDRSIWEESDRGPTSGVETFALPHGRPARLTVQKLQWNSSESRVFLPRSYGLHAGQLIRLQTR